MLKKSIIATTMLAALAAGIGLTAQAQAVEGRGEYEVSIKANKDQITARAVARKAAERDAVRSALKLRLSLDVAEPKFEPALAELAKNLADNLKTTFRTEGDILTAMSLLTVDSAQLTDLARTLGLQDRNVMEAASVLFLIDEYWGIATSLQPGQPLVSEVEVFQDRSSFSDTSGKAAGSSFSDTSAKSSSAASYSGSLAASSKESSSVAGSQRTAVAGSSSSAMSGSDKRAVAVQDGMGGAAAGSRSTQLAASSRESFAGSSSSSMAAAQSSDKRIQASEQSSSARASDQKNVQASAFAVDQKNVQSQKDILSVKTKTVFPDVSNAKPSDAQSAMIAQRLAQVTKQFGLEYTPERDLRETGKGRMLISDIESQRRFDEYTVRAGKAPYNAKYVVYGTSVMSAEGMSAGGQTLCTGMLKLNSYNVDTGRGLVVGTLNKRAQGSSDQDCRSNLANALATELAQTVGGEATKQLQLVATQGQSYTVTLYSGTAISRRVGGPFEDALRNLAGNLREDKRTDSSRVYTVSAKGGDLARRLERLLDEMGEAMKSAEVQAKGNRVVVCLEGKCPAEF